ncbi:unnamed protein product [Rotaria magnacalcarata]|uniref:TIR domain-containing protein n=1 Tax=Rotaria magnacalcarata TaxID=392030 RepID=A0A815XN49_9BILA|nr:unnamed protein product [Rotaria magnacalcarata]CAF4218857.1 unnamed protein product [Rotaria magnacalcarata]
MEDNFERLVDALSISPLSIDVLVKLANLIEQRTHQSDSSFEMQALLILEHWAWHRLSYDSHKWINQSKYRSLFHALALFNRNLILNNENIETETKALLLMPDTEDQINWIFKEINHIADDNDPFIVLVSLWLDNLAFFICESPQFDTLPIMCHTNQYIDRKYVITDQFKFYLTQLEQDNVPQVIFTKKQLFYIKTCSFLLGSYLVAKPQNYIFIAEEVLDHIGDQYLKIINIHSHTMASWSKELTICITYLTNLVCICCCWSGETSMPIKTLFSTEQISNDLIQGLIRIVCYESFHEEIQNEQLHDELSLIESILKFFLIMLQTQNTSYYFRSNIFLPEILLTLAESSSHERYSLCAYAVLGEILTDEKLKDLKFTDSIYAFFLNLLEKGWHHPLKIFKRMPVIYLLRGISSLSKCDAVQQRVADGHSISLFIEMSDEYPIAYDIIWAFSFNKDIQQQLRSNVPFMSKLIQLAKQSENEQMRKTIDGILWNLELNHENHPIDDKHNKKVFDIMISYSHKEKVLCKQIYDELIKAGYRVWIDFDQMHGNVMDAMAQAIEQSNTVIICMSEQYRKSNYCRAEAQYAFQRERKIVPILLQKQYKPDGWLLFIIGQLLYVDFNKYEFPRAMQMLHKELKVESVVETHTAPVRPKEDTVVAHSTAHISPPEISIPSIVSENILEWTQAQVQDWLLGHNLRQLSRLFTDCDGRSLVYLSKYIRNYESEQVLKLLEADSVRRINESISLIELSCFQSLLHEQKKLLQSMIQR